jgi:hypothetical protein
LKTNPNAYPLGLRRGLADRMRPIGLTPNKRWAKMLTT